MSDSIKKYKERFEEHHKSTEGIRVPGLAELEAKSKPWSPVAHDYLTWESGQTPAKGLRFNTDKTMHHLVPPFAQEQYARVLTAGAKKYAHRNWEKGMEWSTVLASMKRHILAFESGEDYDPETGLLHMAHVMCNAGFLTEYYKIAPQYDDRPHSYLKDLRIGLDIDEVCADWVSAFMERYDLKERPKNWWFDREMQERMRELSEDKEFWLNIPPRINPSEIPFEPHCYITARGIPSEWTEEWLDKNGFPSVPVYTVPVNGSKVETAKEARIDIFVDDRFKYFRELNQAGICTYLMDTPHNQRYDVGHKRIKNLKELI